MMDSMPDVTPAPGWHLVLSRDGTVLAAMDGAPPSWVGARLDDRDDVPEDLKEAGRTVLATTVHQAPPVAAPIRLRSMSHAVHLIVVDAVPLRRVPTDLRALLHSTLDVLRRQANAFDVTLKVVVDQQVPSEVSLDAEKIGWAITVLVGNALRYVHHGSQVMPGGSIDVHVTYNSAGPEITIEVQDDGPGIPLDKLRLVFSVGPDEPRAGLGLSMIREVVAAHAGHIDVHSDTDAFRRGTTIRLTLPVS
jgi:signal transduction histidine kinase